jgi:hypothetical protein
MGGNGSMVNKETTFEVRPEHIKLMRRMCVDWDDCEFGAPEIDPKRPYGNSDVLQDIVEILGVKEFKDERFANSDSETNMFVMSLYGKEYLLKGEDKYNLALNDEEALCDELNKLHREMQKVLQIVLSAGRIEAGTYRMTDKYGFEWEYVGDGKEV